MTQSPNGLTVWKRLCSRRSFRRAGCFTCIRNGSFLVGCGEGAAVAYWLGLSFPERFAGIVAINGWLPVGLRPLGRLKACRELPILVVHGAWNSKVPLHDARQNVATLRAGGLRVAFQSYPSAHRLTNPMLSDVDTWLIGHCTSDASL